MKKGDVRDGPAVQSLDASSAVRVPAIPHSSGGALSAGGGGDGVGALQTSQLPVPAQPGRGRPGRTPPPPRRLLLLRRLLRPLLPDVRERLLPPVLGRLRLHLLHPLPPAVGQLRLLLQRWTAAGDVGGVRCESKSIAAGVGRQLVDESNPQLVVLGSFICT